MPELRLWLVHLGRLSLLLRKPKKAMRVNTQTLRKIIDTRKPRGRFYTQEGSRFVGVDNLTGDAWTEDFRSRRKCLKWLKGEDW